MAFGKVTKEDLIALGIDPEKFTSLEGKILTKEQILDIVKEANKDTATAIDEIKGSLAELAKGTRREEPIRPNNNGNDTRTPEEIEAERQAEFATSPTDYVDRRVNAAGFQSAVAIMNTRLTDAIRELKRNSNHLKNSELLKEFNTEIEKYKPENLVRMNSDPYKLTEQVLNMVIGAHIDEINHDTNKREGKYNIIQSSTTSGNSSSSSSSSSKNSDGTRELTEQEKATAKKFNMTEKEWLEQEKEMDEEEKTRRPILAGAGA